MAPYTIGGSQPISGAAEHQAPRIIPAVPLLFSRNTSAARPITPDDNDREEIAKRTANLHLNRNEPKPLTPDSKYSSTQGGIPEQTSQGIEGRVDTRPESSSDAKGKDTRPESSSDTKGKDSGTAEHFDVKNIASKQLDRFSNGEHPLPHAVSSPTPPRELSPVPDDFHAQLPDPPRGSFLRNAFPRGMDPGTMNIVFGRPQSGSLTPSPAPPSSASAIAYPPPQSSGPPSYLAGPPGIPPFLPNRPIPDNQAPSLYSSLRGPPVDAYDLRQAPSIHPPHHLQRAFPLDAGPPVVYFGNGVHHASSSSSQGQDLPHPTEQHAPPPDQDAMNPSLQSNFYQNGSRFPSADESAFTLRDHLSSMFGKYDFADFVLEVSHVRTASKILSIPLHGVIMSRSPTLLAAISDSRKAPEQAPKLLKLDSDDAFLAKPSLVLALHHLYGRPLLSIEDLTRGPLPPFMDTNQDFQTFDHARSLMNLALGYAAAGHILQVPIIIQRGLDIARVLLRWDTLELAIEFSLSGGVSRPWGAGQSGNRAQLEESEHVNGTVPNELVEPSYRPFGLHLLHNVVDFIVHSAPEGFRFLPSASQLPGLPLFPESQTPKASHNPKLSQIQFGKVPAAPQPVSYIVKILSSIFLSLPFPVLKSLLEHPVLGERLGWNKVLELMHVIVNEREDRRRRALKSGKRSSSSGVTKKAALQDLDWYEGVTPSQLHPCGFHLTRLPINAMYSPL